jgi:hypothetical protein
MKGLHTSRIISLRFNAFKFLNAFSFHYYRNKIQFTETHFRGVPSIDFENGVHTILCADLPILERAKRQRCMLNELLKMRDVSATPSPFWVDF